MTELIRDGKYDAHGKKQGPVRIALPFQTIETVNESAQDRRRNLELFASGRDTEWRNRLIWGEALGQNVQPSRFQASSRPREERTTAGAKPIPVERSPRNPHAIRTRLGLREACPRTRRRPRRSHPPHSRLSRRRKTRSRVLRASHRPESTGRPAKPRDRTVFRSSRNQP
jgi:hypothetical protein